MMWSADSLILFGTHHTYNVRSRAVSHWTVLQLNGHAVAFMLTILCHHDRHSYKTQRNGAGHVGTGNGVSSEMAPVLNKISRTFTQDVANGAARSMMYGAGIAHEDMDKAQVGISAMAYDGNPCNVQSVC
jgi:hypothetical protein